MRAIWLTDLHLNFADTAVLTQLYSEIEIQKPGCLLIGGDTAEGGTFAGHLVDFARALPVPIYFVLGNHDFYKSSFSDTLNLAHGICNEVRNLTWLTSSDIIELTKGVALIGHDSWADGRSGDFFGSNVLLNDFVLIKELTDLGKHETYQRLNALGDEAAQAVGDRLVESLKTFERVILLTHVPPFEEACWHEGKISSAEFLPFFVCRAMGETLKKIMNEHPARELVVLCGHTHSSGAAHVLPNLRVFTGGSEYGRPAIQSCLDIVDGDITIAPTWSPKRKPFWARWR